ncbi:MAG TPA: hypothetical protein VMV49_15180 [Candidatus Deferrimicrobium sp.]|nr:hypothetical protein [Candidatus Deferrimicrobium sp.]
MQLKVSLNEIEPKSDLKSKLMQLGIAPLTERIFIPIQILNIDKTLLLETKAVVDTGAIFSLLPGYLLTQIPNLQTISYEMWGIVDTKECKIEVELANIPVILKDDSNNCSPVVLITAAFAKKVKVPILLGMKGLLANYSYSFDAKNKLFMIDF